MNNQLDYVRNTFIKKHLNGYIKKDIEVLLSISKEGKEDGGGGVISQLHCMSFRLWIS